MERRLWLEGAERILVPALPIVTLVANFKQFDVRIFLAVMTRLIRPFLKTILPPTKSRDVCVDKAFDGLIGDSFLFVV
ncbi:MAG: hypothetical protein NTZ90_08080, partial [Proteobacteria bacterium]|nr:hypothetical protein [Pseudomonadota bacterium]